MLATLLFTQNVNSIRVNTKLGIDKKRFKITVVPCPFVSMVEVDADMYFKHVLQIVKEAGKYMKTKAESGFDVLKKSCDIDFVTEADKHVEKMLIEGIKQKFPDQPLMFIGEETTSEGEGSSTLTDSPTFIIDPIDGTMNFVHGFPHSCISIALLIQKTPVLGIIYNPFGEQLFTAQAGKGAFLNDKKITVSDKKELKDALIMMENGTSRDEKRMQVLFENQQKLIPIVHGTRSLGSAALNMAMVALGCADAYFEFGIHIWDIAAGEIIVKEAGGVVVDPTGKRLEHHSRRVLCASTPELAEELAKNLVQFYPEPRD